MNEFQDNSSNITMTMTMTITAASLSSMRLIHLSPAISAFPY